LKLSINQAATYARSAGFSGDNLIIILAIAMAESGLDTTVQNSIGATGILQIYLAVHPDVTYAQAIDPGFSFRYAWKLSGGGKNFCPWQSYDSSVCGRDWDNRYKQYMAQVRLALGLPGMEVPIQTASNVAQVLTLSSNASVAQFLADFDTHCEIKDPFDVDTSTMQETVLGGTIISPVSWLTAVGTNFALDSVAIVLRVCFLVLGTYLLFRVIDHYLNVTGAISNVVSTVGKVAAMA